MKHFFFGGGGACERKKIYTFLKKVTTIKAYIIRNAIKIYQ